MNIAPNGSSLNLAQQAMPEMASTAGVYSSGLRQRGLSGILGETWALQCLAVVLDSTDLINRKSGFPQNKLAYITTEDTMESIHPISPLRVF